MEKRTILFRGKRVDNGEWVEGSLYETIYNTYIIQKHDETRTALNAISVNPETIGQFTGITDKTGKRIFEGDLVSFEDDPIYEVVYDNTYSGFVFKYIEKSADRDFYADWLCLQEEHQKYYVIRGNVHDKPELL